MRNVKESARKEVAVVWARNAETRLCGEKFDDFGSTWDEEEEGGGGDKATMDGQNQGGHERERRTTRSDAGPSCVEAATRQIHRPHVKGDKMWKKTAPAVWSPLPRTSLANTHSVRSIAARPFAGEH